MTNTASLSKAGLRQDRPRVFSASSRSFAYTEGCEDPAEQLLTRHSPGDLAERLVRVAQLLRHELAGLEALQLFLRCSDVRTGATQCIDVACTGADRTRVGAGVTDASHEMF